MKEFNQDKKHNTIRNPKRNIVILSISLFLLGILSVFIYKSYAVFKISSEHEIINAVVGNFGWEYNYTGEVQEFTAPKNGYYKFELWGAQGGITSVSYGGLGAYTKGTIYLEKDEILYVYVGSNSSSFNGGEDPDATLTFSRGGGATDIRLIKASQSDDTVWNESTSLRSRIMVAGAGGGGGNWSGTADAAHGGGLIAASGVIFNNKTSGCNYVGRAPSGGSQTSSGLAGTTYPGNAYYCVYANTPWTAKGGSFGVGGQKLVTGTNGTVYYPAYNGGGGGGGYYGGGSGAEAEGIGVTGAGGSSYISGYAGVNSVQESGGTVAQPLHTNSTLHYSGKYFIDTKMEAGVNSGNGRAKITSVRLTAPERANTKLDNVRYIKSCLNGSSAHVDNHWVEIQAIKDGVNVAYGKIATGTTTIANPAYITNGLIDNNYSKIVAGVHCAVIDLGAIYDLDEIGLWLYWSDGRKYNDNVLSVGETNTSGTTSLSTILHNYPGTTGYNETSEGKRYTTYDKEEIGYFTYTGGVQEFTVPEDGYYEIELWGASGGWGVANGVLTNQPAKGGYTKGTIALTQGEKLYIFVGGAGGDAKGNSSAGGIGGYNGGGTGGTDANFASGNVNEPGGGGGGATDVRLSGGTWNDTTGLRSRIMVAAGAGGSTYSVIGGYGGGLYGENAKNNSQTEIPNTGGGQTLGNAFGFGEVGHSYNGGTGGGGGGYYGGKTNASDASSGAGGSSFISGHNGCDAINESGTHTGQVNHYSGKIFTETEMIEGSGFVGNGSARITKVS